MKNSMLIYLLELIFAVITLIVSTIIFKKKRKNGLLKGFGVTSVVFLLIFGVTYIFERPEMQFNTVQIIEVNSGKKLEKPITTYHFRDVTDEVNVVGNVNYGKLGEYTEEFEFKTLTGTYVESQIINIVDSAAPEITLEGEENYRLSYKNEYEEPGVTAIDAYDGDITDSIQVIREDIDELNFDIKYIVKDTSGNKTEKVRHITIIDDIAPEIKLNGSKNLKLFVGEKYTENGATAIDEIDGDLSDKIQIEGSVDTEKEDTYKIIYKVADNSGNVAIAERIVGVVKINTNISTGGSENSKGVIYLTFDDGPTSSITPKVLDVLREKGIKATFFILNYDSTGEELVKREVEEGHTVGIHGYSHIYEDIYKSVDAYMNNITKLQDKIMQSTGYNATITRFPGGSSNTVSRFNPGIMTRLTREVVERGYRYFDWNVSSGDAGGARTSEDVYNNVVNNLSKNRSNVVLMHDFSGNTKTLNALADIIDYGLANGYTFCNITENTPMVTHGVNN